MIRGKYLRTGDAGANEVFSLRERVYIDEMDLSPFTVEDEADAMAIYALVYDEAGAPRATGRLAVADDRVVIDRVCVERAARGQGLGDLVMRMLLVRVREMGLPRVHAHPLLDAAPFFERYGFKAAAEPFETEGRSWQLMSVRADEIDIEGDCHRSAGGCAGCGGACGDGPPAHPTDRA